jgi:hypothetical protein
MFQTKVVEKTKTNILCSVTFFQKSWSLWAHVEKYGRAWQATDGNIMRRMRFIWWINKATDTRSELCNTYCFSTATMVTRTRLNATLHEHCLSCWSFVSVGKTGGYESSTVIEFLVLRLISTIVFWDVTPCSLVDIHRRNVRKHITFAIFV